MQALKNEIRAALEGTSAQKPVETAAIAKGHARSIVYVALMELYEAREVGCCKIIKFGNERVVWWIVKNSITAPVNYRLPEQPKRTRKVVRRMSELSIEVRQAITSTPGISLPELAQKLNKTRRETARISNSITYLLRDRQIRTEGVRGRYRYFPGAPA